MCNNNAQSSWLEQQTQNEDNREWNMFFSVQRENLSNKIEFMHFAACFVDWWWKICGHMA